ncbi:MAG: hypothetical protein K2I19_01620, partial [Muribaculaceae bacterium]|nr:hypothetical protein [Muribaculaceae bacterium]
GEKTRTSDLHVPNVARCQLCYTPIGAISGCFRISECKVMIFFSIHEIFFDVFRKNNGAAPEIPEAAL